jgi:hypothetical protein
MKTHNEEMYNCVGRVSDSATRRIEAQNVGLRLRSATAPQVALPPVSMQS